MILSLHPGLGVESAPRVASDAQPAPIQGGKGAFGILKKIKKKPAKEVPEAAKEVSVEPTPAVPAIPGSSKSVGNLERRMKAL